MAIIHMVQRPHAMLPGKWVNKPAPAIGLHELLFYNTAAAIQFSAPLSEGRVL